MSPAATGVTLEECLDALDEHIETLGHYPPELLAQALRVHLGALLHALIRAEIWSEGQVREFLAELAQEAVDGERAL